MVFRVIFGNIRLLLLKLIHPGIHFSLYSQFSGSLNCTGGSKVFLGRKIDVRKGAFLSSHDGGILRLGENVFVGSGCYFVSRKAINIGDNTKIGPNTIIYDHDHDYFKKGEYLKTEVEIGNNVWIGAGCIILRGTKIGNNSVIGAGTLLKGDYPSNSMIYNKKETIVKPLRNQSEE
jgi:Acetyltransferase (isoleucine patch superfamily)